MKSTVLVSGGDTPLGNSIIQKALTGGFNVVATAANFSRGKNGQRGKETGAKGGSESLVLVPWQRMSPVSARNVVLKAISAGSAIDRAVLVHSLTNERRSLHELPLNVIQELIDLQLKSHLFFAKEVLSYFLKRKSGNLSLVLDVGGLDELATIDNLVAAGFAALADSLMKAYRNEPVSIDAFDTQSSDVEDFASFIVTAAAQSPTDGKWHHHAQRSGVFRGGIRSRARR